ncbi:MAG: aldolase/citrate lyase family protein [Pirellulales bacterium]|nr:aldolase/citrate lyase family protein [Pirellulales bacterium]
MLITALHLTDPSIHELTSLMGFDGIWLDMEHHTFSLETASSLMRAARVGAADIVARPAKGEFMRMQRMLEAGAQAIMYPRCDDAREAAEVAKWMKFPPLGKRGFDGGNPDMPYCTMPMDQYVRQANEQTLLVLQVEQPNTVEEVEEIAAVEGVDVLFVGKADLSLQGGVPGQMDHESVRDAIHKTAQAAKNSGKHWGCPSASVQQTEELLGMGARFIAHNADIVMIKNALEQMRSNFAPLGFTFDDRI